MKAVAPVHDSSPATISTHSLLLLSFRKMKGVDSFGANGHFFDRDRVTDVVEKVTLERKFQFVSIGHVDISYKMLTVGDLVRAKSDVDAGVEGRIESTDVNMCTKIVVELGSWDIVVL